MEKCKPDEIWVEEAGKCCQDLSYYEPDEVFPAFWKGNIKRDYSCFDFDQAFDELSHKFKNKLTEHGAFGGSEYLSNLQEIYGDDMKLENFVIQTNFTSISEEELKEALAEGMKEDPNIRSDVESQNYDRVEEMEQGELCSELERYGADDKDELVEMMTDEEMESGDFGYFEFDDTLQFDQQQTLADYVAEKMWGQFQGDFEYLEETYDMMQSPPDTDKEKAILMDRVIDAVHVTGSLWDDCDVEQMRKDFEEEYEKKR